VTTPAKAVAVARDYWKTNEQATMRRDAELFARIHTGLILEADRAWVIAQQNLNRPALAAPRPLRQVTAYVPRQRGFPAEFIALIETVQVDDSGHPSNAQNSFYDHFVRPAADAGWKVDFTTADVNPGRPLKFALDRDGYATALPVDASEFVLPPNRVGAALATYLDTGVKSGTGTGPFASGPMTTESVKLQREHDSYMTGQGYIEATEFKVLPYLHAYRSADGGAIVLFALRPYNRVTTPPDHCIIQPAQPAKRQWGGLVPPGTFSAVFIENLLQLAATDPPAGARGPVDVVDVDESQVAGYTSPSLPGCG
jgi:hypothetical protein